MRNVSPVVFPPRGGAGVKCCFFLFSLFKTPPNRGISTTATASGGRSSTIAGDVSLAKKIGLLMGADEDREMASWAAKNALRAKMTEQGLSPEQVAAYVGKFDRAHVWVQLFVLFASKGQQEWQGIVSRSSCSLHSQVILTRHFMENIFCVLRLSTRRKRWCRWNACPETGGIRQ